MSPVERPVLTVADGEHDELLDAGSRRWLPRWAGALAVVAVAAAVAGVLFGRSDSTPRPTAPTTSGVPALGYDGTAVDAIITVDGAFFALGGGQLVRLSATGAPVDRSGPVERSASQGQASSGQGQASSGQGQASSSQGQAVRLVAARGDPTIWVVPIDNEVPGFVEGFDTRTLTRVARVALPAVADDAASLDGQLYVSVGDRLLSVAATRTSPAPVADIGLHTSLVADPSRHRLLYLAYPAATVQARSWSPGAGATHGPDLPLFKGQVAVVAGAVWVAGFARQGAQLLRIDPARLRPTENIVPPQLAGIFGPGILIEGTGDRALYIRGATRDDDLYCLDGVTGEGRGRWPSVPGRLVSTRGHALDAPAVGLIEPFDLGRCPG